MLKKLLFISFLFLLSNCANNPLEKSETKISSLDESPKKQTICLNMIVKNEAHVIRRCLDSVKDLIDYWVIMDTGSKDGTQDIIKAHMKGIPGELHERPWINWGETRTEALQFAKGKADYILFMDADDILEYEGKKLPELTEDLYCMWRGDRNFSYLNPQVAKDNKPWKWIGVTHEYLGCDEPYTQGTLETIKYTTLNDGATRSFDPGKYRKNVDLLEEGLKKEPNNIRYAFYLAESYHDSGERAKALQWYQKRVNMGGWEEEIFWSKLRIAHILKELGLPDSIVIEAYKDALGFRPHRVEPYYHLAEIFNHQGNYSQAYAYLKAYEFAAQPDKKDALFNVDWIKEYGMLFQLTISAYYVGHYEEALKACDQLLENKNLPESWRSLAEANREFPLKKISGIKPVEGD